MKFYVSNKLTGKMNIMDLETILFVPRFYMTHTLIIYVIYDLLAISTITETQTADICGHRRAGNDTKNDCF